MKKNQNQFGLVVFALVVLMLIACLLLLFSVLTCSPAETAGRSASQGFGLYYVMCVIL